jgi:hypothetical protein
MIFVCVTEHCYSEPLMGTQFCRSCTMNRSAPDLSVSDAARLMVSSTVPPPPEKDKSVGRRVSDQREGENSGGDVNYYCVMIAEPKRPDIEPYMAECEDIIEHLGMDFAEGSAFKSIWRKAAQRTLGHLKRGADSHGVRDSEKVEYYGKRLVAIAKRKANAFNGAKTTTDPNVK